MDDLKLGGLTLFVMSFIAFTSVMPSASQRTGKGVTEWPMWGGSPDRNMVSDATGLPTTWDVKTGQEHQVGRGARIAELRQSGRRRRRRAGRHEQRSDARSEAAAAIAAC